MWTKNLLLVPVVLLILACSGQADETSREDDEASRPPFLKDDVSRLKDAV
jgi:hypothetical protein